MFYNSSNKAFSIPVTREMIFKRFLKQPFTNTFRIQLDRRLLYTSTGLPVDLEWRDLFFF